uniref:signal peptidase II n=1 Tax=Candidatus Planktophila sp. TaxID=2175601 RepID=UPI00404977CB
MRPQFSPGKTRTIWLTAWIIWLFDYATKSWALSNFSSDPQPVIGTLLQFTLLKNSGAAFSFASGFTLAFSLLAVAVIATIVRYAARITSRGWLTCAGLLLGGVLGNLTDRIFREPGFFLGHVIDWIQIPNWPVFNIADIAISTAALLAFIQTMRSVPPITQVQ